MASKEADFIVGSPCGAWPLTGHALKLARAPFDMLISLSEHGDLVELRMAHKRWYFPCHPDLVWQVVTDDRTFDRSGPLWVTARKVLGNGLVFRAHEGHRAVRRTLQQHFGKDTLPHQAALIQEELTTTLASWRHHQDIDLYPEIAGMAARTITRALFSSRVPPEAAADLQRHILGIMNTRLWRLALPSLVIGLGVSHPRQLTEKIYDLRRTLDATAEDGIIFGLEQSMPDATAADIAEEVVSLYAGAIDSIATTVSWALYLLARNPDSVHRLQQELEEVLQGRSARLSDLPHLPHTARVLTETLRLYPPTWFLPRSTTRPVELAGKQLPVDSTVVISPVVIQRNPALFKNPHEFDPDRWLPERALRQRGAYIPFGAGAHRCVAEHFGMTQAVLALATISHLWNPQATPMTDGRPIHFAPTLTPRRLILRTHAREMRA